MQVPAEATEQGNPAGAAGAAGAAAWVAAEAPGRLALAVGTVMDTVAIAGWAAAGAAAMGMVGGMAAAAEEEGG